jgi:hypothetical protein
VTSAPADGTSIQTSRAATMAQLLRMRASIWFPG